MGEAWNKNLLFYLDGEDYEIKKLKQRLIQHRKRQLESKQKKESKKNKKLRKYFFNIKKI